MAKGRGPSMIDVKSLIEAGINPKTGLPIKMGNKRCTTKEDFKKVIRDNDLAIAANKFVWYNMPLDLSSQEIEKYLYYRGQLAFFYCKKLEKFMLLPFTLAEGLDIFGRFAYITPIPFSSGIKEYEKIEKMQAQILAELKLKVYYTPVMPENLTEEDLYNSAVIIYDRTKQWSQTLIPTQILNDSVIDLEAEAFPFLRTAMLNATGTKGIRVADDDQYASVLEGARNMIDSALHAEPYVPMSGTMEWQLLTEGSGSSKALEFLQTAQALDNFRLGCHGVPNGGLWDKSSYVNAAQTELNMGGADVSLKLQDGLTTRQTAATVINSIWGLGAWCEPNETIVNMDLDGDGVAYERNEGENSGGTDDGSGNETNVRD